jgi:hypothetical protein
MGANFIILTLISQIPENCHPSTHVRSTTFVIFTRRKIILKAIYIECNKNCKKYVELSIKYKIVRNSSLCSLMAPQIKQLKEVKKVK